MTDQKTKFRQAADTIQNEYFSWVTLGSLTGMVAVVTLITKIAQTLNENWTSNWIPFLSAIIIIEIYTLLTFDWSTTDDKLLRLLKAVFIALINGFVVYGTFKGIDIVI